MRRYSLKTCIATAATLVVSLGVATSAQAGVVAYQGQDYGVMLNPNAAALPATVTPVTSSVSCLTPSGSRAAVLPSTGLCYHGGSVMHKNETFAFTWDPSPHKDYAAGYVAQFLKDVANGSGSMSSPYAITSQYNDATGAAANDSRFGGHYEDTTTPLPNDCTWSGTHYFASGTNGYVNIPNDTCLTDADVRQEVAQMVTANGLDQASHIVSGYTPLFVLMTPPGVVTCLDSASRLCSANSNPASVTGQFCSYHSTINIGGATYAYIVQPFTAGIESPGSGCDEPDTTAPPATGAIDSNTLVTEMGARLVNPLSQAQIASIVNPGFAGWYANNGAEINDNRCVGLALGLDTVSVGGTSYILQREFNNGGVLVDDAFAYPCAPSVALNPTFVVPSPISTGDVVQFDAGATPSTLVIPSTGFQWNFGDGTSAVGPAATHSYAYGGNYTVKLTVTDRGGYTETLSQTAEVQGPPAPVATSPTVTLPTSQPGSSGATGSSSRALAVRITLRPQSLQGVLRSGISINVFSSQNVNGIVTVSIARSAAKRAHIASGRSASVVIGRGTSSQIKAGSNSLHLKLSQATVKKLKHLGHVTLTIRLAVVAAGGRRMTIDAAGHY